MPYYHVSAWGLNRRVMYALNKGGKIGHHGTTPPPSHDRPRNVSSSSSYQPPHTFIVHMSYVLISHIITSTRSDRHASSATSESNLTVDFHSSDHPFPSQINTRTTYRLPLQPSLSLHHAQISQYRQPSVPASVVSAPLMPPHAQ